MSDNGKQFDNPKFRDFCAELGIKNCHSSLAHPQSNGQAEVTIRTLKAALKTKALFDKLLKMFKPLKMEIFNGFNFLICLITKF